MWLILRCDLCSRKYGNKINFNDWIIILVLHNQQKIHVQCIIKLNAKPKLNVNLYLQLHVGIIFQEQFDSSGAAFLDGHMEGRLTLIHSVNLNNAQTL